MYAYIPLLCLVSFGGQKALDPLELVVQPVDSCHVSARNRSQVFWNSRQYSKLPLQLQALYFA